MRGEAKADKRTTTNTFVINRVKEAAMPKRSASFTSDGRKQHG